MMIEQLTNSQKLIYVDTSITTCWVVFDLSLERDKFKGCSGRVLLKVPKDKAPEVNDIIVLNKSEDESYSPELLNPSLCFGRVVEVHPEPDLVAAKNTAYIPWVVDTIRGEQYSAMLARDQDFFHKMAQSEQKKQREAVRESIESSLGGPLLENQLIIDQDVDEGSTITKNKAS